MAQDDRMLGFADKKALAKYQATEGGFLLGQIHPDHGVKGLAAIHDNKHVFIVAGSRSGKGITLITNNLLTWKGGAFVVDPKGENASLTACRRASAEAVKGTGSRVTKHLGQKVAILDPFGTVRGASKAFRVNYDPLTDIQIGSPQESDQIMGLVEGFVLDDKSGAGAHFTENVATIFAGAIEAILHKMPKERHRLASLIELMRWDIEDDEDDEGNIVQMGLLSFLESVETEAGLAQEAASVLSKVGEEEAGSFSSTASRQLKWLFSPQMRRHVSQSKFSLVDAVRDNWTVYVCIPPSKIPRYKRWLRIVTKAALDAKMESPFEHDGQQSLFLLDEFSSLGHFQIIEDAAAYMAGYGIKLVPIIQNLGQVKKLYEKNFETFLSNAGAVIGWGFNDLETEQYFSDRMGKVMVWEVSESAGGSKERGRFFMSNLNKSKSASMRERSVRLPNEVHADGARENMRAFIVPASGQPFMARRVNYFDAFPPSMFEDDDSIKAWEKKHGR